MNPNEMVVDQELRLRKAHITLMRHVETALYSGCMMLGETSIEDKGVKTAYTDGINKRYGRAFLIKQDTDAKVRGLVLHENLHVAFRHSILCKPLYDEDARRANQAADYVINGIIVNLKDKTLCTLPEGGLVNPKYFDWGVRDVFNDLKGKCGGEKPPKGPKGPKGDGEPEEGEGDGDGDGDGDGEPEEGEPVDHGGFDEHDFGKEETAEEQKKTNDKIDRALREGMLLAGRLGADVPRAITDTLEPRVDWREVLREFVTSNTKGKDEYTWRMFNRRQLANDVYLPTVEDETVGEIISGIDTSGSIGQEQLAEFAGELMSICETVQPDMVRVLWWDTRVAGEQLFEDRDYAGLATLLKPKGGGGTLAGCVSSHIIKERLNADCIVMFTDGYTEQPITWDTTIPTLWLVTSNRSFAPPSGGKVVMFD